ncbi:MAG: 23S rRNA (adenine(2030)-N(6))-methyltransferase RlmJ [Paraglaciecola sp.]|nr:23S rRNA (adenine(2030)-N(6))-methyltransferase RlmJ [Paraglaciecola sp.]
MFSYRHSFHAGNHADVIKHLGLMLLIAKLKEKDKGFVYMDTHSGAGLYDLHSDNAQKTGEFKLGIDKLMDYQGSNNDVANYVELISRYHRHNSYPGSPEIARTLMREQDKLVLMEWHNQEIDNLRHNISGSNIAIHHRDGFEGLLAMTPPPLPRGLVLIDPSYEVAEEYQQVAQTVAKAYKRWSTAIFAIWYPLIAHRQDSENGHSYAQSKMGKSEGLLAALKQQNFKNLLQIELCVTTKEQGAGMYGSGLAVINAPWQFDERMRAALTELQPLLAQSSDTSSSVSWLIAE